MYENNLPAEFKRTHSEAFKKSEETMNVVKLQPKVSNETEDFDYATNSVERLTRERLETYLKENIERKVFKEDKSKPETEKTDIERVNKSFLALRERQLLNWLVARTPQAITPNHLSLLGLGGAVLAGVCFAACNISNLFIVPAAFGVFLNWLGDSLDGSLARFRKIERPEYGYLIDHSIDLIANSFMFLGLGLSPYFTLFSALLAMAMYFLFSSYTYLKVVVKNTHNLSYGSMGATELRILIISWSLIALAMGPGLIEATAYHYRIIDLVIGSLWSCVLMGLFVLMGKDLSKIWSQSQDQIQDNLKSSKKTHS